MAQITKVDNRRDKDLLDRLAIVGKEIENLAANMLTGLLSPALAKLLADRKTEKARIEAQLTSGPAMNSTATILPHPALLQQFEEKVARLRETLNDEAVRGETAEILSALIESVTIYPDGEHGPEAEIVANVADLLGFAANDNAACEGGVVIPWRWLRGQDLNL